MKWWGWGDPNRRVELPDETLERLRAALGADARRSEPVQLDSVRLAESRLSDGVLADLTEVAGPDWVRTDRLSRVVHAAGKGYPDLVRMRAGSAE